LIEYILAVGELGKYFSDQTKLVQRSGALLGLAQDSTSTSIPLGYTVSALIQLFQSDFKPFGSSETLPPSLAKAIKQHGIIQEKGKERKPLDPSTDPGEFVAQFLRDLPSSTVTQIRRDILKRKGYPEGKLTPQGLSKCVRGNLKVENTIYEFLNLKTGVEFIGASQQPLIERVVQHFREAFFVTKTQTVDSLREFNHAIRLSNFEDWRVFIISRGIAPNELKERSLKMISYYRTSWPHGYNNGVDVVIKNQGSTPSKPSRKVPSGGPPVRRPPNLQQPQGKDRSESIFVMNPEMMFVDSPVEQETTSSGFVSDPKDMF